MENLRQEKHKTLIFSRSTKILDIIQKVLGSKNFKMARIDGRVTKMSERDNIVCSFQKDPSYDVCLLTTQVGGVGLTLTAADRVVIFDPRYISFSSLTVTESGFLVGILPPIAKQLIALSELDRQGQLLSTGS